MQTLASRNRELLRALEADERVARVHFVASLISLRALAEKLGSDA